MTIYEFAKKYRGMGLNIMPIDGTTKKPLLLKWKFLQARYPTDDEFEDMFKNNSVGIGLIHGHLSKTLAADFDTYKKAFGSIPYTPVRVKTPRGGVHGFFKFNKNFTNSVNEEISVDIRAEGAYTGIPPTFNAAIGKGYEWDLDGELDLLLNDLPELPEEIYKKIKKNSNNEPFKAAENLLVKEGARNSTLFSHARSMLAKRVEPKVVLAAIKGINLQFEKPLESGEVEQIIKSALSYEDSGEHNSLNSHIGRFKVSWPKPLAKEAFHGLVGEIIEAIEPHSEADPAALLINFLTCFGSVVGDKPYFSVEADRHHTRIFEVLVGETSKARKGTSLGHIIRLFETIDPSWVQRVQTGLSSGEGLISAVQDEIRKKQPVRERGRVVDYEEVVVEEGIADKRLLVIEEEFASTLKVMGREGNTLSPVIRRAWDTGNLQSLTKNSPTKATGAHISIIGHITREELLRYLTATETANGFGNRFVWSCVKRSKCLPRGSGIQKVDFAPLIAKLKRVVEFAKQVEEIRWAEETEQLWDVVYPDLSEGKLGIVGAMTGRAEAYVTRIACIYALLDLSQTIKPEHLMAALADWDYNEASVRYIFQGRIGSPLADEIQEILAKRPNSSASRTEISNFFQRHISSEEISSALNILRNLDIADYKTDPSAGRNTEIWYLTSEKSAISEKKGYLNLLNSRNSLNSQANDKRFNGANEIPSENSSTPISQFPSDNEPKTQISIETATGGFVK